MRYDHEDDVLMIWLAEGKQVDHADHVGQSILHLTESGEPVLLEILNAREFVVDLVRTALTPSAAEIAPQ
jgi:uncharacterized protein YuzE